MMVLISYNFFETSLDDLGYSNKVIVNYWMWQRKFDLPSFTL